MDKSITVSGVTKTYRKGNTKISALSDLNLKIEFGEFLALMGPSGSGKSTLLNLISGLDRPTHGEILVGGVRIDRLAGSKLARWRARNVGFIFQFYNLMPTLSAQRNVELPLLLTRLSGAQRRARAAAALELVRLSDRVRHRPGELSGGQQQRVAIARALVTDPSILVCDEPTGDLDRETAVEILELLRTLNQVRQKTIIMVTHDHKAAEFASRIVHMDKGALAGLDEMTAA